MHVLHEYLGGSFSLLAHEGFEHSLLGRKVKHLSNCTTRQTSERRSAEIRILHEPFC